MQQTYKESLEIIESLQKENDALKKETADLKRENKKQNKEIEKLQKGFIEIADSMKHLQNENKKLRNELRKYVNENTPSGSIPPYLKKLEKAVDKYSKEGDDRQPVENVRNARSQHIDRKEHHSTERPVCPKCGSIARRRGTSTRKRVVIELQLPKAETVEHECDIYQCSECNKIFSASIANVLPNVSYELFMKHEKDYQMKLQFN